MEAAVSIETATTKIKKHIRYWQPLMLGILVGVGLLLRLYGLNWDQGNRFHPDEPYIVFYASNVAWPQSPAQFFDPVHSPLNPHFFAYGSLPIYLLALLGHAIAIFSPAFFTYAHLNLLGRVISAVLDSGTILLTAMLAFRLCKYDTHTMLPRGWWPCWRQR
ncbi:hypothetical protein [Dictyobacter kobayashii]|uniref:Glycosyltransferase RgtA/B/C/D-like domain-containing protein n=1 Tax=Dictyobacter kobayashii TaxID=2014872 RepID=A0A402AHN1_9CHLR|nr:hypothetical protein [Dictyobacter kobayashii]GCE18544.1 hypothetical protein KDK_23440 [Dictyobacter kobayashii]